MSGASPNSPYYHFHCSTMYAETRKILEEQEKTKGQRDALPESLKLADHFRYSLVCSHAHNKRSFVRATRILSHSLGLCVQEPPEPPRPETPAQKYARKFTFVGRR
jgi:hypothetical protein